MCVGHCRIYIPPPSLLNLKCIVYPLIPLKLFQTHAGSAHLWLTSCSLQDICWKHDLYDHLWLILEGLEVFGPSQEKNLLVHVQKPTHLDQYFLSHRPPARGALQPWRSPIRGS